MLRTPPLRRTTVRNVSPNRDSSCPNRGLAWRSRLQIAPQTAMRGTFSLMAPKSRPTAEHAAWKPLASFCKLPLRQPQDIFSWVNRDDDKGVLAALQNPTLARHPFPIGL